MPASPSFSRRMHALLPDLAATFGTPFHLYDAAGIRRTHEQLVDAFDGEPHRQFFAVKALPNPAVLRLLVAAGSGLDCASPVELELARRVGATGEDVVFTSNNTAPEEYRAALDAGALITIDDRSLLDRVDRLPLTVAFRVAPHGAASGSVLMGGQEHSKFGVPVAELADTYREARDRGATRFGIHGMTCANELDPDRAVRAAADLMAVAARVQAETGIRFDDVNVGGGLGIPYRPEDRPLDVTAYARALVAARRAAFGDQVPRIMTEIGRFLTGPHGVLVTTVVTRARKARAVAGLDASMSALMRPALYGAYHHVSLPYATGRAVSPFDVVGSLCENMDKFALDRPLPDPRPGDLAVIHDTGAHGHAMGFTYNGRLRPAELLLTEQGDVVVIRRAETFDDYVATVEWDPVPVHRQPEGADA